MDKFISNKRFGFTLIEILVVIAIMGALAVIMVPMILDAPVKARDANRIETMEKIANFLLERYSYGGALPTSYQFISSDYSFAATHGLEKVAVLVEDNLPYFGGVFPEDPVPDRCWGGNYWCGGFFYYRNPTWAGTPYEDLVFTIAAYVEDPENGNNNQWFLNTGYDFADSGTYYVIAIGK